MVSVRVVAPGLLGRRHVITTNSIYKQRTRLLEISAPSVTAALPDVLLRTLCNQDTPGDPSPAFAMRRPT